MSFAEVSTKELLFLAKKLKNERRIADADTRRTALENMAKSLMLHSDDILCANAEDVEAAKGSVSDVMIDRLTLTKERIAQMSQGITEVSKLPDPLGRVISENIRGNGLDIKKVSVPIGVIAIIYESRPNVTADAAALSVMSGNICILRGGKEAYRSNRAIVSALREGLRASGLEEENIGLVSDTTRQSSVELMEAVGYVDLLIPRGGAGLIRACVEKSKVPCIQTGSGICHIYVDKDADLEKALDIVNNAKTSRPSVCNAAEVCLVHEKAADRFLPMLRKKLVDDRTEKGQRPVELRLCEKAAKIIGGTPAGIDDFDTEFLDYILAVKIVGDVKEAVSHIAAHSTSHSEAIITEDPEAAKYFTDTVDSAAVYVNASTRFTDGGEFGLGCEMGISTQKLHARGPMGLCELTSYKYIILGDGQTR